MPDPEKPRIYTSCFCCETVIRDNRDLLTAIRIGDGFTVNPIYLIPHPVEGTTEVDEKAIFPPLKVGVVLIFRAERPVQFIANLKAITPGGRVMNTSRDPIPVNIPQGNSLHVMNIDVNLNVEEEGNYCFDVYVDDILENKMLLHINHATRPLESIQNSAPDSLGTETQP